MGKSIEDPKVYRLAREFAELTGQSVTQAATTALEAALVKEKTALRERRARLEKEIRFEEAWAIAQDCARRLGAPGGTKMLEIEDLYDEKTGLPR